MRGFQPGKRQSSAAADYASRGCAALDRASRDIRPLLIAVFDALCGPPGRSVLPYRRAGIAFNSAGLFFRFLPTGVGLSGPAPYVKGPVRPGRSMLAGAKSSSSRSRLSRRFSNTSS